MAMPITTDQPDRSIAPDARSQARDFILARLGSLFSFLPLGVWVTVHLFNQLAAYNSAGEWETAVEHHASRATATLTFIVVLGPLLWHTIWGLTRIGKSRPHLDVQRFSNLRYLVQRLSAVGLLLFLGAHLWLAWFRPRFVEGHAEAFADMAAHMRWHAPTTLVYVLGVLGIAYHLANGLWSFSMGWGITVSKQGLAWMERVALLVFVVLAIIGLAAVYGLYAAGAGYPPVAD